MNIERKTVGNRTMLIEDGLHVGTIVEQDRAKGSKPGLYQWLTSHRGGHVGFMVEAENAIRQELER